MGPGPRGPGPTLASLARTVAVVTCPQCGEENPDKFRLCGYCGAKLAPDVAPAEVRKTVTVVFSDLVGSTSLGESVDSETLRELLAVYFAEMRAAIEHHGGLVEKYIGDAVMAVFGLPRVREDDALRAVRAALEMRERLAVLNQRLKREWGVELQNRTGVNTGEVVAGDPSTGQRLVTGDTVNVAARLEQACPPLGVLLGDSTYRLVRTAVDTGAVQGLELKGKSELVTGYELLAVREAEAIPRNATSSLVGRKEELSTLMSALEQAKAQGRCQLVTVFAPAGMGKSRLLREFADLSGATVRSGRCLSYGDNLTFAPLSQMVRTAAGITEDDSPDAARAKVAGLVPLAPDVAVRIGAVLGLEERSLSLDETFWAATAFLETLCAKGPTIWLVDDIHWAEPVFLKLLRHLAAEAKGPLVVACSSRPELREEELQWGDGERQRALTLTPLSDEESHAVVANLLHDDAFNPEARERIAAAAGGNPLYVEQLVSMLLDDGALQPGPEGGWVVAHDLGHLAIPPSISALLSARLDRLRVDERQVLERAAVIGQACTEAMVVALCDAALRPAVGGLLLTLVRKDYLRVMSSAGVRQDDSSLEFVHGLVRETTYQGLLKRTRAELHQAHVDWLEAETLTQTAEQEEVRGYHLEQAFLILADLGRVDERLMAVGRRASKYLVAAGNRALGLGDMQAAGGLFRRAAAVLPEDEVEQPSLLVKAGEALAEVGDAEGAEGALLRAQRAAQTIGREEVGASVLVALLNLRFLTNGATPGALEEAERQLETLARYNDHLGMARAYRLILNIHLAGCRYVAAAEAAARAVEEVRRAGDTVLEQWVAPAVAGCAQLGPTPVAEAIGICQDILEQNQGNRRSRAVVLWSLSHLEAMRGDFEAARALYQESRALLEGLGVKMMAALTSVTSGPVEFLAGNWPRAEQELRGDYDALRAMGERNFVATTAALLAEAVYRQGRAAEALALTEFSRETAAADDVATQFLWRCVAGKAHADAGAMDLGERLVREGVAIISAAEIPVWLGTALLDEAYVLAKAGRPQEARSAIQEALRQFEAKGDTVSAGRAHKLLLASNRGDRSAPGADRSRG